MNNIKVVWICHFSNNQVRSNLKLKKYFLKNYIKKILKRDVRNYFDFAPWITNYINEFEKIPEIDLHIISPHKGLYKKVSSMEINEIKYHFFRFEKPLYLDLLINKIFKNRRYRSNRRIINSLVSEINPDLINLIGAENPYYSISVLDIFNIPIFVTLQTVYSNPDREKFSFVNKSRWDVEVAVHKKESYFGCQGVMHRNLLLRNNPNSITFRTTFPIQYPPKDESIMKKYDFVLFAALLSNKKGIEDALEALSIVVKKRENVTLLIVGMIPENYLKFLSLKVKNLSIEKNVIFAGYFEKQSDMHKFIQQAKFALLPNKLDIISGTTIEAMILGLVVVTYKTSGTPFLNKYGEAILLCDIENIEGLSRNMLKVLDSDEIARKLQKNAYIFIDHEYNNNKNTVLLVEYYRAIIDHFHKKSSIPNEFLFDENYFL